MSKEKVNYWSLKNDKIKELLIERGLDIPEDYTRKKAIEALQIDDVLIGEGTELLIDGDDGLEEVDPKDELIKVKFHHVRDNEAPYIFLGHNGKSYYVPKEEVIYVPKFLLDSCVKDAVEEHADPITRDGKIIMVPRHVQRFPYSVILD